MLWCLIIKVTRKMERLLVFGFAIVILNCPIHVDGCGVVVAGEAALKSTVTSPVGVPGVRVVRLVVSTE